MAIWYKEPFYDEWPVQFPSGLPLRGEFRFWALRSLGEEVSKSLSPLFRVELTQRGNWRLLTAVYKVID